MDAIVTALGFNARVFLLETGLFLALLVFMNAFFWKPIMAHLAGRDQEKADAYRRVESTEREMESLRADYMARITQIEAEARSHIQAAIKEAQSERERIIAEARAHSEATLKQGAADLERSNAEALNALRDRMVGIASLAADKALGSAGDKAALRQTIESRIAQSTPTV